MTFEQKLTKMLSERGMFEEQCIAVMEQVKADKVNESMATRWEDAADDYPAIMLTVLWLSVKDHALAYIDANLPLAWFRPLFTEDEMST